MGQLKLQLLSRPTAFRSSLVSVHMCLYNLYNYTKTSLPCRHLYLKRRGLILFGPWHLYGASIRLCLYSLYNYTRTSLSCGHFSLKRRELIWFGPWQFYCASGRLYPIH